MKLTGPFQILAWFILGLLLNSSVDGQTVNVVTFAGTGASTPVVNGPALTATFGSMRGLAFDSQDNCYVADYNHFIRKISKNGIVSTFAGSGTAGSLDGTGAAASFNGPIDIDIDANDNLYVADVFNHKIRKITINGVVTTYAGSGSAGSSDGPASSATFNYPHGLLVDKSTSIVYIADSYSHKIRKVQSGTVSTLAGDGSQAFNDGSATSASFYMPHGLDLDAAGNIYIADFGNNRIRKLSNGIVSTVVGTGASTSVDGSLAVGTLTTPHHVEVGPNGLLYVADKGGHKIRVININTNTIGTYVGTGVATNVDGANTVATLASPERIRFDSNNVAYVAASLLVRKIVDCSVAFEYDPVTASCKCPIGKFALSGGCSDCPIGSESNSTRTGCNVCPGGKFRPSTYVKTCQSCPLFATCNTTALVSCQSGYKINSAGNGCEQCPAGTQTSGDSLSCVSCNSGSTYRTLSQSSCQSCPINSTCTVTGFTCNSGYELNSGGSGCQLCQEGYSKSASGNTACTQCVIGTESAVDKQSCTNCGTGYYRSTLTNSKCTPCPTGATCSSTAITRCANGWKINSYNDGCDQCPLGQDSFDGVNCQVCSGGKFKPNQDYDICISCPVGSSSCSGSSVSCPVGYIYDSNVQCKRNDTYFALIQTTTQSQSTVTVFSTQTLTTASSVFVTATTVAPAQTIYQTLTVISQQPVATQTNIVISNNQITQAQTVTISQSISGGPSQQQAQSANSVTIDLIGITLPLSPLIFAAASFGAGFFIMLILALVCCRKSPHRRKDEEFDGGSGMTTTMNTQSQRTFTNSSLMR